MKNRKIQNTIFKNGDIAINKILKILMKFTKINKFSKKFCKKMKIIKNINP